MFGNILKKLRQEKGMTQSQLAKILKMSPSTVGMYEQNRRDPDTETLQILSSIFNVSIDYLLGNGMDSNLPTHKELEAHDTFMKNLEVQFMDASERDRDKIYNNISKLYWKYKDEK